MAYPTGITTGSITGTFLDMVYDKETGLYSSIAKKGFVHVTPGVETIRLTTTGVLYDISDLQNAYYALDEDGSFTAEVMIPSNVNIEPNNWSYTVKFSWTKRVVTVTPTAGTVDINELYVPSD